MRAKVVTDDLTIGCFQYTCCHNFIRKMYPSSLPSQRRCAKERSGNGETWYTLFEEHVGRVAALGEPTVVTGMGDEREATYQGRTTWVSFASEAGGCLICSGDADLSVDGQG